MMKHTVRCNFESSYVFILKKPIRIMTIFVSLVTLCNTFLINVCHNVIKVFSFGCQQR